MYSITVEHISKSYKAARQKIIALQDVSFDVEKGELFGMIGPDGAGKTSLFRILTTLILADQGNATVDGLDVVQQYKEIRKRVGYMPGRFSLYQDLTVKENLNFFATIFNSSVEANYELIKDIYAQIEPFSNRKAGNLSGGMKQKLALSCALIHRPSVLFLDEPTTGVDAVSRTEFWEMLKRLKHNGITILVSTPYMDEAARCDRVALMQSGSVLAIETPQQIVNSFQHTLWGIRSDTMWRLLNDMKAFHAVEQVYPSGINHHVILKEASDINKLRIYLEQQQHTNLVVEQVNPAIEDCFMQLMQQ